MISALTKKIFFESHRVTKNGNIKISSTSKTKKIIATKKKRSVKGMRALNLGENPHSKGLIFSRSKIIFFLTRAPTLVKIIAKIIITILKENKIKII